MAACTHGIRTSLLMFNSIPTDYNSCYYLARHLTKVLDEGVGRGEWKLLLLPFYK